MYIIVNSDVIHTNRPIASGLPEPFVKFCREAASVGCVLVIPRTALLEHERHQDQLVEEAIAKANQAVQTLKQLGANIPNIETKDLVKRGDFLEALKETGIPVEIEEPSLEDYQDAEFRACFHLSPQPPSTKNDEMRDLVIWNIALRVAEKHSKAILVSRDEVHSHDRGTDEAKEVGLLRAKSFDEALELIGRESPSVKLVHSVVEIIWPALVKAKLPVPEKPAIRIIRPEFTLTASGRTNATFTFVIDGPDEKFAGVATVRQISEENIYIKLQDVTVNEKQWKDGLVELKFPGKLPQQQASSFGERLAGLEDIIGTQE